MKLGVYAVKDKAADAFLPPFFLPSDSMAIREFTYACTQIPDHRFGKFPTDYSLYKVGEFDDGFGRLSGVTEPVFLIAADNLKVEE